MVGAAAAAVSQANEEDHDDLFPEEQDDPADGPYNERDEAAIKVNWLETLELELDLSGGGQVSSSCSKGARKSRKKKKRKSAIQQTSEMNMAHWRGLVAQDGWVAETVEEACRWSLAVFSPRQLQATHATYS